MKTVNNTPNSLLLQNEEELNAQILICQKYVNDHDSIFDIDKKLWQKAHKRWQELKVQGAISVHLKSRPNKSKWIYYYDIESLPEAPH